MRLLTKCSYLLFYYLISSCSSPKYEVSNDEFKSNRELWGLKIAQLKVDSIAAGIPAKYSITKVFSAGQKGDHVGDAESKKKYGSKWIVKEYGYMWKPQKRIPFRKINKYYNWWNDSINKCYDTLPLNFDKGSWYLLTQWQDASTGGGKYDLYVYINDKGEFETNFDIETGP